MTTEPTITLVRVEERFPDKYVPVIYVFANGNHGSTMGYHNGIEWELEYSDDHPDSEDIKYWIEIKWI